MARIDVVLSAGDEDAAKIIEAINQFPAYTVERAEMEAHVFMVLARVAWREADFLRASEARRAKRAAPR